MPARTFGSRRVVFNDVIRTRPGAYPSKLWKAADRPGTLPRSWSSTVIGSPGSVEDLKADPAVQRRVIVVLDAAEVADYLVRDMTDVLMAMCARLYGGRSAVRHAGTAVGAAQAGIEDSS